MEKKKIIAIPGWVNDNKTSFGCGRNHLEFVAQYGTPRILMPGESFYPVDMLYLPGGADLSPSSYGGIPSFMTGNQDVFKQYFYDNLLKDYVDNNVPIFGVCLGMQMLAAYFGSKLSQDLKYHAQSKDRWETAHNIFYTAGTDALKYTKGIPNLKKIEVNSHHHQGVLASNLGAELIPLFFAIHEENPRGDEIVEVFKHSTKNIFGVQYHPEELYDAISHNIITEMLNA